MKILMRTFLSLSSTQPTKKMGVTSNKSPTGIKKGKRNMKKEFLKLFDKIMFLLI